MKWTPGPWRVEYEFNVVAGRSRGIANTGGYSNNIENTQDENKANAHLIAAAPELYEALDRLYELHCATAFRLSDPDYIAITKAAAALAKARGQ